MEKQSHNNSSRRHRRNRPRGGNRNRSRSGRNRGGSRSNGNSGSRNRNRSRRRQAPKPTTWQKFLQFISFGKLGRPKRRSGRKQQVKQRSSAPAKVPTQRPDGSSKRRRQRSEVTSGRLYVGNLTYATTEEELEELFRGFGTVVSAEVVTNSRTQQSKGFAFVEMASLDQAKRAVEILDNQDFLGRKITVSGARSEGPRKAHDAPDLPESKATQNQDSEEANSAATTQVEVAQDASPEIVSRELPSEASPAKVDPEGRLEEEAASPERNETEEPSPENND